MYGNLKLKKDDLKTLLEKTHKIMFTQSVYVLKKVLSNVDNLRRLIERNKKIKWSKYLMTRKKLDKLYEIKFPITKADFVKKIRSLQFKEYRLFIKINNKKIFYKLNEKKGIVFWITGLSGSGKSTIAKYIKKKDRKKIWKYSYY